MMEPDSKYHKERRLAIARLRIPMIEQTWRYYWERTLATASPEFPTMGHHDSPLHGLVSLPKKPALLSEWGVESLAIFESEELLCVKAESIRVIEVLKSHLSEVTSIKPAFTAFRNPLGCPIRDNQRVHLASKNVFHSYVL
jgi:hypothetical protein